MTRSSPLNTFLAQARDSGLVKRLFELAREEDLGSYGDITSQATIPADRTGTFQVVPRQASVLSGLGFADEVVSLFGTGVTVEHHAADGDRVAARKPVATLRGSVRGILSAERTLLNLIGRLSGIATRTATFIEAMGPRANGKPELCDTRKTTPGMRVLEKYAVACGGGHTHRMGLHDALLIKDNHIAGLKPASLPGKVAKAIRSARSLRPQGLVFTEVEVDGLDQLAALLADLPEGLDIVLLDNMAPPELARAVEMRNASGRALLLEASGGVNLDTVRAIAATGVDRISVGSLTHGAISVDFGLDAL